MVPRTAPEPEEPEAEAPMPVPKTPATDGVLMALSVTDLEDGSSEIFPHMQAATINLADYPQGFSLSLIHI